MTKAAGKDEAQSAPHPSLVIRALTKSFAGFPAINAFDLTIAPGEVHALVGENGSGKSTLIKILSGYHRPDPGGEILIDGTPLSFGSPDASYSLGCRFVHQDLGLIATSSILDNLSMNTGFPTRFGTIRGRVSRQRAKAALAKAGLEIDPRTLVGALTPALATGVAVARALKEDTNSQAKLLVFDEPTARLPVSDVHQLASIVRQVASTGVAVLYVTHRLDEVFEFANNVTVLRDGRKVTTVPVDTVDRKHLIHLLVGSEFDEVSADSEAQHSEHGDPIFEVSNLSSPQLTDVSFNVRPGEVLGIAGITGSGRETILGTIFGATPRFSGTISVAGYQLKSMRPDLAMGMGVAYLPPDRKTSGGIMTFSARENITLTDLRPFWRWPFLRRSPERAEVASCIQKLSVRPAGFPEMLLEKFSGGNQQKILFAKWLRRGPKVLMLDEPTQGVDVGAKAELHRQLLAAAAAGTAVIASSSDVDELAALCHRVIILRQGRIVADLTRTAITARRISSESLASSESPSNEEAMPAWK
jgi:ribose transport system ATP-binding protein